MVHHVLAVHAGPFRRRAFLETEAAFDLVSKVPHIDLHRENDSEETGLTIVPHKTKGKLVLSRLDSNARSSVHPAHVSASDRSSPAHLSTRAER